MNKEEMIKKYVREGKLRKVHAGFVQVEALLKQALLDIDEAKKIVNIADRATYILTYMAMLKAGRALLLVHGYQPDDGAQHNLHEILSRYEYTFQSIKLLRFDIPHITYFDSMESYMPYELNLRGRRNV